MANYIDKRSRNVLSSYGKDLDKICPECSATTLSLNKNFLRRCIDCKWVGVPPVKLYKPYKNASDFDVVPAPGFEDEELRSPVSRRAHSTIVRPSDDVAMEKWNE